jgi:hypothetical protein
MMPLDERHEKLELAITDELLRMGYLVGKATYHDVMAKEVINRLKRIYDPTSLYIRGRADRIAVHTKTLDSFEWEAKTHESTRHFDMCLEALPLAHHLLQSTLGVRCLYIYQHQPSVTPCGFWVSAMPPIREIRIPDNWGDDKKEWFCGVFKRTWPEVCVIRQGRVGGSGDPFLVIDAKVVATLPDWKSLAITE